MKLTTTLFNYLTLTLADHYPEKKALNALDELPIVDFNLVREDEPEVIKTVCLTYQFDPNVRYRVVPGLSAPEDKNARPGRISFGRYREDTPIPKSELEYRMSPDQYLDAILTELKTLAKGEGYVLTTGREQELRDRLADIAVPDLKRYQRSTPVSWSYIGSMHTNRQWLPDEGPSTYDSTLRFHLRFNAVCIFRARLMGSAATGRDNRNAKWGVQGTFELGGKTYTFCFFHEVTNLRSRADETFLRRLFQETADKEWPFLRDLGVVLELKFNDDAFDDQDAPNPYFSEGQALYSEWMRKFRENEARNKARREKKATLAAQNPQA